MKYKHNKDIDDFDSYDEDVEDGMDDPPQQVKEEYNDGFDDIGRDGLYDGGFGFGSDSISMMDKHPELLKDMANFEKYKTKLYRGWRGLVFNPQSKRWEEDENLKIVNEKGANWGKTLLETYGRDNNILSQLKEDEQNDIINVGLTDTLFFNLADNYGRFGFKNASAALRFWNEIDHGAILALSGSDGSYSKVLAGQQGGLMQYREGNTGVNMVPNRAQKKSRFLNWFGFGGKK